MKVVISAGGRFHAHRLAQQLQARNSLLKLFTFDFAHKDSMLLDRSHVLPIAQCKIINDLFTRLNLGRIIDKSRFNVFKDNLFDTLVSKKINSLESFDLFVGWSHYTLSCIPAIRKAGAKIIIESGSCHILSQQQLLCEEYQRWQMPYKPIDQRTIDKMLAEYYEADYIMTLSSFAQKSFIDHEIPENKVLMTPCGVDVEFFLQEAHLHKSKFLVIFVGLVSLRKGIQYLLQAWSKLKLPAHQTELIIVGAMQKDFATIMHKLPIETNVTFVGPTDRETLRKLYQQSSLFILPSIEEGFGMVIGEAMAAGLPVICSKNSAGPDLIKDQEHGFLITPSDIQELAEKIQWCYEYQEDAAQMGREGQKQISSFSWDTYGARVYELYNNIVTRHKK